MQTPEKKYVRLALMKRLFNTLAGARMAIALHIRWLLTTQKGLYSIDTQTGKVDTLVSPGFYQVEKPFWSGNTIYFSASYTGIDNIYALNINDKKVYQVTSALNGAFDACVNQDTLIYANYTMDGMAIVQSVIDSGKWNEKKIVNTYQMVLADKLSSQEPFKYSPDSVKYIHYDSRPYRKIGHLFHIHSWVPLYANGSATTLDRLFMPGYTVANQNLLNTFVFSGGQGFRQGKLYSSLNATWQGWFPSFSSWVKLWRFGKNVWFGKQLSF